MKKNIVVIIVILTVIFLGTYLYKNLAIKFQPFFINTVQRQDCLTINKFI